MAEKSLLYSIKILLTIYIFLGPLSTGFNLNFTFPNSITLNNGNIFVIHKYGVSIFNTSYPEIINKAYFFEDSEILSDEKDLSSVLIKQFEDGYVLCTIINKIYIFDSGGKFEFKGENIIQINSYITLTTHYIQANRIYYFLIGYIYNQKANLYYYKYDSNERKIYTNTSKTIQSYNGIKGLSCEFMKESSTDRIICMYSSFYHLKLLKMEFNNNNGKKLELKDMGTNQYNLDSVICIKSSVNQNKEKTLFCLYRADGEARCMIYNINSLSTTLYYDIYTRKCRTKYYSLKVNYLHESDEFAFSCITNQGGIQIITFEKNLADIKYPTNKLYEFNNCSNIYGHSILYPIIYNKYFILSDINCGAPNQFYQIIIGDEEKDEEEKKEKEKKTIEKDEQREEEIDIINEKNREREIEEEK